MELTNTLKVLEELKFKAEGLYDIEKSLRELGHRDTAQQVFKDADASLLLIDSIASALERDGVMLPSVFDR
jgi:hypothetical protein